MKKVLYVLSIVGMACILLVTMVAGACVICYMAYKKFNYLNQDMYYCVSDNKWTGNHFKSVGDTLEVHDVMNDNAMNCLDDRSVIIKYSIDDSIKYAVVCSPNQIPEYFVWQRIKNSNKNIEILGIENYDWR